MVVITVILFFTNAKLAAITVFAVLPPLLIMSIWFRRASERGYTRCATYIALGVVLLSSSSESLQGVRIVTAHNRQRYNVETHRYVVVIPYANNYTGRINAVYGPGSQLISVLCQLVILAVGGAMYLHHPQEINLGQLTAFFLVRDWFFSPIQAAGAAVQHVPAGPGVVFKLRTLLETEPSVSEGRRTWWKAATRSAGEIRFDHVSFGYYCAVPVLHDVDLTIDPGETVAFVGATGAGKSTTAKLVTRFYDPVAGRVLIDGYDLKAVTLDVLRSQLGVVPQEPFLFAGTIRLRPVLRPAGRAGRLSTGTPCTRSGWTKSRERLPDGLDTRVH